MEDPPTVEELKRENDDMRRRIEELEEDADAKLRALEEERENRVSIVQEAREEERRKIRAEMEKLKQKMTSDHLREVDAVREHTMLKAKQEMADYQQTKDKEVEEKLRPLKEKVDANTALEYKATKATEELTAKHEAEMKKLQAALFELENARKDMKARLANAVAADKEKSEEIRRVRDEHEKEMKKLHAALFELENAREDMKGRLANAVAPDKEKSEEIGRLKDEHEKEMKKLHAALFESQNAREDMKGRLASAVAADKEKSEEIRRLRDEHEKEMKKVSQASRTDNKKQVEEIKELQRRFQVKDRELITIKEKCAHVEMEKERLEDKLKRIKMAESWEKMSPRSSIAGEPFSPLGRKYSDHEKDVMVRNSELSYLARSLQDKTKALEEEKKQCQERAEKAELLNKPLQDKVEKLLKKIDHFTANKSTMEKKIATLNQENVDLRSSRQELEGELERQKRTFQRKVSEARTHSGSVTKLKEDLRSAHMKTEELTRENQKLKEANQKRTKELGRLRKELAGVKKKRDSLVEQFPSDTPPSVLKDDNEEGSGSQPSLTEGDGQSEGRGEEPDTQTSQPALEQEELQEPESVIAQEKLMVVQQEHMGDPSKAEELQARVDELEYFIMEQDEVKKLMKEHYEQEGEQARQEQAALREELQKMKEHYEQEAEEARQEQAALREELQKMKEHYEQEAEEARQEQAALREELQKMKEHYEQEAEEARQEQAALREELQKMKEHYEQEAEQARQEQAAPREELQKTKEHYEQEAEQPRQEQAAPREELQKMKQHYEQEAEQARQEQAALREELQKMKEHYEEEAEQARQEQAALREELQKRMMEEATDGENGEEHSSELQRVSEEVEELKAQLLALQDTVAKREETVEKYQQLIVALKAKLQEASGGSSASLHFPEPQQLESYISDLEDSETKLREIYEELLDKPLFLVKKNQDLEEALQEARKAEEELNEQINHVKEKLNALEAEKEEKEEELNKLQMWLDEKQPALAEREDLQDKLAIAHRRIEDLEQMQEELLNKAEEAASSDVPPAPSSQPQRTLIRRESEVMRQSGTKVIERSITVVEHVQATVLDLRKKMLLSGVLEGDRALPPEEEVPQECREQGTAAGETGEGGAETKKEVQETARIDIGTEMNNLTEQLAEELQNLMQIKDDVTDRNSPLQEGSPHLSEIVEESAAITAEVGMLTSGLSPGGTENTNEDTEGKLQYVASDLECPSEYETPHTTARRDRGIPLPTDDNFDHDYAEIADRQRRASGVYEPVEIRRRTRGDSKAATAGEVEVEPMIAEEPKLVWSAPPDFESFEKELEEHRQNVLEKETQLKAFEEREKKVLEELATVAPENERMKAKLSELEEREASMAQNVAAYESQLKDYRQCLSELNDKMDSADFEKQKLESDKFDLETKLGEKEELLGDCSHLVPVLHKKIEKVVAEGEAWKNQYNTLLEQMPEITDGSADRERVEELEAELETWKKRFEELSRKGASANIELLNKLQSQMVYLQKELDQKAKEILQLRAQLNPVDRNLAKERSIGGSRVFVALFDYEPSILCHTGHPERELEFTEGDVLEVTGEMDESGFHHATLNNSSGLVPVNFVEEVDVKDPSARSRLYNQRLGPVDIDSHKMVSPVSLVEEVVGEEEEFPISFTALGSSTSPDDPTSFSVAPGNKPQPPRQVKVVDAFPNGITMSWQPPPNNRHGNNEISGYLIVVGAGEERSVPGHGTSMVSIPDVNYADLSSLRLCSMTKDGAQSDWVTVFVGHGTTPFPARLQGPPLSGSYAQGSLYDSLKLGQSAASPMNSFQDSAPGVPASPDPVPAANMCVALYDYDPQTSSPNDEPSDELSLTTGDTVKVLENVRDDGFVKAELKGRVGLVPISFLEKVTPGMVKAEKVDADLGDYELLRGPTEKQPVKKMVALYDYDPSSQSPNMDKDTELAFRKGHVITVCGPTDQCGFFMGERGGKRGFVPSNFVEALLA